jgi:hypothetical protein
MICEADPTPPAAAPALRAPPPTAPRELAQLELIFALDPRVIERARRLEFALRHLRAGMPPMEVRLALRLQFHVSQQHAWRIVDVATDLAGPV